MKSISAKILSLFRNQGSTLQVTFVWVNYVSLIWVGKFWGSSWSVLCIK